MDTKTMLSFYDQRSASRRYWSCFSVVSIGFALDYFDFFIVGFLIASLAPDWHLTFFQASVMLMSGGLGSIFGSLVFGSLGDRFGRKPILLLAMVICALAGGALAFVPRGSWFVFAILRIVVGAGLGGIVALQYILLLESTPTPLRVKLMGWPVLLPSLGVMLAAGAGSELMAVLGWRGVAMLGFLPLLLCIPFALILPESPRWLLTRQRVQEARASIATLAGCELAQVPTATGTIAPSSSPSIWSLYQRPARFWQTVIVWVAISTANYGVYLWGPTITSMILEIKVDQAARYFVWISSAGMAGRALFCILPAYIGRVWSGRLTGLGIAACLGIAAAFHDQFIGNLSIFVIALAAGALFFDGGFTNLSPYTVEIFPTQLAARGVGLGQSANGLGKIFGPMCLALIAGSDNYINAKASLAAIQPAFFFLAACGVVFAICFLFAPETKGRALLLSEDSESDQGLNDSRAKATAA